MKTILFFFIFLIPPAYAISLNFLFYCQADGEGYDLFLGEEGKLQVKSKNNPQVYLGTYSMALDSLTLSVPNLAFEETSMALEQVKGFLITFNTPSLRCHLVGHDKGRAVAAYVKCPTIKYIPSISYENNAFEFYANHMVKRRIWKELLRIPDTLYSESYGIYYIEGDKVFLAFGDREDERFLSGVIQGDEAVAIQELEPEKGPCKVQ